MALRRFACKFACMRKVANYSTKWSPARTMAPSNSTFHTSSILRYINVVSRIPPPDGTSNTTQTSSITCPRIYSSTFTRTIFPCNIFPLISHFSTSKYSEDSKESGAALQYVAESWPDVSFQTLTSQLVHVLDDEGGGRAGLLTLCGPRLNALSNKAMREVLGTLEAWDDNPEVGAMVITGSEKAFAAGADISEMKDENFVTAYKGKLLAQWAEILDVKKPIIAAVSGFALGGGCELAMMCDILLVGENAVFGQPEINLGVLPGMGGTQRLIRAVGKSRAMEMILSGNFNMNAREAVQSGLASRIVPGGQQALLGEAISLACRISAHSQPAVAMAKEAISASAELGLREGLGRERNLFHAAFGLEDQKEGMNSFLEKRKPVFRNR